MPYDLVKETLIRIEERPCPCDYCTHGYGGVSTDGNFDDCTLFCGLYKMWLEGAVVIPEGFTEVREINE